MDLLTVDSRQTRESGRPCFVELEDCTPLSLAVFGFVLFPSYLKCPKSLSDLFAYPLSPLTYSFLFHLVTVGVSSDRLIKRGHFKDVASNI